jgi:non-specific protein-tyrosine kinase
MARHQVASFVRRWGWLLALGIVLADAPTYVISVRLPRVYEARATLLLTPAQGDSGALDLNAGITTDRLTPTYTEVIKSRPVVEAAMQTGGLDLSYEDALRLLDVTPVRDTQLIQITGRADSPDEAARRANLVAAASVQWARANQASRLATSRDSLTQLADELGSRVVDRTSEVEALRSQPPSPQRDQVLVQAQAELTQEQQAQLEATRRVQELRLAEARSRDLLKVVEPAAGSPVPVQPRVAVNVAMAAVIGLLIALGVALLLEALDDRLWSVERLRRRTGLRPLGAVGQLKPGGDWLSMLAGPSDADDHLAAAAESFRLLRANLRAVASVQPLGRLLVTSGDDGDGKTTVAANLAVSMALAGGRVVLVDADLRAPALHEVFGVPNATGLSSLLADKELPLAKALVATHVAGLRLVPSGPPPANPGDLVASEQMGLRLAKLRSLADALIVDSPSLAVSDAVALAGWVDGVLLVVNAERTRGAHLRRLTAALQEAGTVLVGAVLNRARPADVPTVRTYPLSAGQGAPRQPDEQAEQPPRSELDATGPFAA